MRCGFPGLNSVKQRWREGRRSRGKERWRLEGYKETLPWFFHVSHEPALFAMTLVLCPPATGLEGTSAYVSACVRLRWAQAWWASGLDPILRHLVVTGGLIVTRVHVPLKRVGEVKLALFDLFASGREHGLRQTHRLEI